MPAQVERRLLIIQAEDLVEALHSQQRALAALLRVYDFARDNFKAQANDIDPTTIALGIQAEGLGIKTMCQWLTAISEITSPMYKLKAEDGLEWLQGALEDTGLVLPDNLVL